MSRDKIRKHDSEFANFLIEKFRENPPFESTFDAWKTGYLQGMEKAAEIESQHHVWKGAYCLKCGKWLEWLPKKQGESLLKIQKTLGVSRK